MAPGECSGHRGGARPAAATRPRRRRRRPARATAWVAALALLAGVAASAAGVGGQRWFPFRRQRAPARPAPTPTPTPSPSPSPRWRMGRALGRCTSGDVRVRKEVRTLTRGERQRFVAAVAALVASGVYAQFVPIHAMWGAHGRASFFPWHRLYLLEFEEALREVDPRVSLPFCTFCAGGAALVGWVGVAPRHGAATMPTVPAT